MSKIYAVGDSHSRVFKKIKNVINFPVDGGTNMGLKNPHSKTNAKEKIDNFLSKKLKKEDTLIFLMGEVDCGFVIWYRKEKYNDTIESQFNESINNYFDFILSYKDKCNTICVCDVPPPTIGDNDKVRGDVANKRLGIKATLKERTILTKNYNDKISDFCQENNFINIKYMEDILNEEGTVNKIYKNSNPKDHHLEPTKYSKLLRKKLSNANII